MLSLTVFLKQLRLKNNNERLSDMARKVGISSSYLSSIENKKRKMNDKLLKKIVDIYALSKDEADQLTVLRNLAAQEINIPLKDMDEEKKETIVKFLSNIDTLSSDDFQKINYMLNSDEEES